jgi:pimeloyl-ACP methyl ester carboxylesterase
MTGGDESRLAQFADRNAVTEYFHAYDRLLTFWPTVPEKTYVATSFGATHVLSTGPATAPPLVLFHGLGATAASWYPIVGTLSQHHRIHAVDTIGDAGRSVHNGRPLASFDAMAMWASEVLDALHVSNVDVGGHSLGGHLALRLALAHPQRLGRLVLLDPPRCFAEMRLKFILYSLARPRHPSYEKTHSQLARGVAAHGPADDAYLDLIARGTAHFPAHPPPTPHLPTRAELHRLRIPTLHVLAGASEVNNPRRCARAAARYAPVVRTKIVPDATHSLIGNAPQPTSTLVQGFLNTS